MQFKKLLLILLIVSALTVVFIIIKLNDMGNQAFKEEKQANSYVINTYEGYKGKPNYRIMLLADSQTFTIPKKILHSIQVGDSVRKEKGKPYFEVKSKRSGKFEQVYYP